MDKYSKRILTGLTFMLACNIANAFDLRGVTGALDKAGVLKGVTPSQNQLPSSDSRQPKEENLQHSKNSNQSAFNCDEAELSRNNSGKLDQMLVADEKAKCEQRSKIENALQDASRSLDGLLTYLERKETYLWACPRGGTGEECSAVKAFINNRCSVPVPRHISNYDFLFFSAIKLTYQSVPLDQRNAQVIMKQFSDLEKSFEVPVTCDGKTFREIANYTVDHAEKYINARKIDIQAREEANKQQTGNTKLESIFADQDNKSKAKIQAEDQRPLMSESEFIEYQAEYAEEDGVGSCPKGEEDRAKRCRDAEKYRASISLMCRRKDIIKDEFTLSIHAIHRGVRGDTSSQRGLGLLKERFEYLDSLVKSGFCTQDVVTRYKTLINAIYERAVDIHSKKTTVAKASSDKKKQCLSTMQFQKFAHANFISGLRVKAKFAKEMIAREMEVAKRSGVQDNNLLHEWGQSQFQAERSEELFFNSYRKMGGSESTLSKDLSSDPCKGLYEQDEWINALKLQQ